MANPFVSSVALCALLTGPAWAINGSDLILNSGIDMGTAAQLNSNGYAGTYITLNAAGTVTVTVNAQGTAFNAINPHMNIVIDDTTMGWNVGAAAADYSQSFSLPAGTHFIRTEFNNNGGTARSLAINSLDISGAAISNVNSTANALAAASTYTTNFRKGLANVSLAGVAPGSSVHVKLKRHAFNFGTTVPNSFTDTLLINNPAPGSDAANFQQALVDNHFSSLAAENGAKWASNEATRDVLTSNAVNPQGGPNIPYMDRISDYAQQHDMRYRQHNLIWGPADGTGNNNQQPTWAYSMLTNPSGIDTYNAATNPAGTNLSNKDALYSNLLAPAGTPNAGQPSEINERIKYFAQDRAQRFSEIDVYNESYHTGSNNSTSTNTYWDVYGASGVAQIYKQVKDAIQAGGGNARTFVNEYSVLQQQGGDYYANWYARHIEDIQNAGKVLYGDSENVVGGIGFQYYAGTNIANHDPARIYATMQNLAVQGQPMALTEWGVTGTDNATNEATAATILEQTARLVFGMPGTTGMTLWNLRNSGAFAPVGTLYDANWTIRDTGIRWQSLMSEWSTDVMAPVNPDGALNFNGFYGLYDLTLGAYKGQLTLIKGTNSYALNFGILPGDFNYSGKVDAADYTIWRDTFGSTTDLRADADHNGVVNDLDYGLWVGDFGAAIPGSGAGAGSAAAVPEPSSVMLCLVAALGMAFVASRRR